jgi:sec-independent protein translocase protein TatC
MSDEGRMPFLAHLEELRKRLIISFSAIGVAFVLAFNIREYCLRLLQWPLTTDIVVGRKFPFILFQDKPPIAKLTALGPAETLWTHFKVAFIVGAMLAIPVLLYQIWKFIEPGLLPKEKRFALPFVVLSTISFFIGVAFCFFIVLPMAMQFLLTFDPSIQQMPRFGEYVDFTLKFLLAFGAIFELPLGITIAARLGMVTPQFLARNRKYAILVNFVVAAILTPTPDVFNQALMALPMCVLYEVGILAARIVVRRPKPAEAV